MTGQRPVPQRRAASAHEEPQKDTSPKCPSGVLGQLTLTVICLSVNDPSRSVARTVIVAVPGPTRLIVSVEPLMLAVATVGSLVPVPTRLKVNFCAVVSSATLVTVARSAGVM